MIKGPSQLDERVPVEVGAIQVNFWVLGTLAKTGMAPLSTVMRRLLTGYAQQFNRRHRRHGHLFPNRYKSILCEEDTYLLELVRYIHLNPIRAGMVKDVKALKTYPYTGHSTLMGKADHQWQDTVYIVKLFNTKRSSARRAYSQFVSKGTALGSRPELAGGGLIRSIGGWAAVKSVRSAGMRVISDERILGGSDFAETVLKHSDDAYERRTHARAKGVGLVPSCSPISKIICHLSSIQYRESFIEVLTKRSAFIRVNLRPINSQSKAQSSPYPVQLRALDFRAFGFHHFWAGAWAR